MRAAPTPPPAQVIIGLDVGTTAVKAVAFGLDAHWRYTSVREYPLLQPQPGWQVQDPEAILSAAASALAQCIAAARGSEVVAVSVSSAMHGLIGLDAAMRPLTPLLTWADSRASDAARRLRRTSLGEELHRLTGTPVHPMSPLAKLIWFGRHEPKLCAAARWWVGLKDYVLLWLTGTLVTELSSASATGLLDLSTRRWSPLALDLAGVTIDQLPTVLATTSTLGLAAPVAGCVGLPSGTPVVVGAADGPLGNLGTGAISPGEVGLSLGTSGAVRMVLPAPQVDDEGALFCYALTDNAWVVGGAVSNGGHVVRWAGRALAPDLRTPGTDAVPEEALLDLAAAVPAGSDGLVMLPYLLPERAPLWDLDMPAAYLGLRSDHTRGHLIRAAVEGVCLQLSTIVDRLDKIEPVTAVRVTGGAFRSPLWRDVLAAVLDRPIHAAGDAEGSALGAAALGLLGLGTVGDLHQAVAALSDPACVHPVITLPDLRAVDRYRQMRKGVGELIGRLTPVTRILDR